MASHILLLKLRLIDNFDRNLFSEITHSGHCLHHLLPPLKPLNTVLTVLEKENNYQLPNVEFSLYKNCFINRCLFKFR